MSTLNVIYNASACVLQADLHRQVHVHAGMPCKFNQCIHACMHALHVIAPKHCHVVAMGMPLLQLPNSLLLQVLSIKHWRQSTFAEMPSIARAIAEKPAKGLVIAIVVLFFVTFAHISLPVQQKSVHGWFCCDYVPMC